MQSIYNFFLRIYIHNFSLNVYVVSYKPKFSFSFSYLFAKKIYFQGHASNKFTNFLSFFFFINDRMSQDRPSSRDGSTKLINMNHILTTHPTTTQIQYNNNNNLIINKNNFLAIETTNSNNSSSSNNNSNSHLLVHKNINAMPSISTTSPIAAPMSYTSKLKLNK